MSLESLPKSRKLAARLIHAALVFIRDNGGEMPLQEIKKAIEEQVELDDWATARYEKTGNIRWHAMLHFFSIDAVKAGFLVKENGVWYLTPEGEEAISLGEYGLHMAVTEAYKIWRRENPREEPEKADPGDGKDLEEDGSGLDDDRVDLEQIEQIARDQIEQYITNKNAYEFQDLAAALLRGMGYHTPFVAPKGKDGGIDIVAYRDPLGTESPRIKVQVKHRKDPAGVQEIRQLMGILRKDGDVGIFISSGGFTADARNAARDANVHVELINQHRFIALWREFYSKLNEQDKAELPLTPIYFLTPPG